MVPTATVISDDDVRALAQAEQVPSRTYRMRLDTIEVQGFTDEQEAMRQAVFKILQTERYRYDKVYSDNYGVQLWDLFGQPIPLVLAEIPRRITEALTWDERITGVGDFSFEVSRGKVHTSFAVYTIYGSLELEWVVNV